MTPPDKENPLSSSPALFDQLREELTSAESPLSTVTENAPKKTVKKEAIPDKSTDANPNTMPHEARKALVSLMRHGVILAAQKSTLFTTVCRHQNSLRRHLSEVYLKLVLDEPAGVAFIASVGEDDTIVDEEGESASLIVRRTLTLYDTLLLLVLRKYYQERETVGEQKVVTDIEQIESWLIPFLPLTTNSRADRRKLSSALKKMTEKKLLSAVRGSEDRYEITPIIRYVVSADFLESLLQEYQRMAKELGVSSEIAKKSAGDLLDA